jgi:Protein of unknown function (DUF2695)
LVFETCNGEWRQGVALNCDGMFIFDARSFSGTDGLVFWHDTAPPTVELALTSDVTVVRLKNVWDVGDGVIHCWHNGAAMIVEELPNGRRYRCNDGFPDDDFEDIVFRLERVGSKESDSVEMSNDLSLQPRNDLPPISRADLKALFDHLNRPNPSPCTLTFKETMGFLKIRRLPIEQTLEWLRRNGAGCDCEVIFNTDAAWGEWAGRLPPDEE